MSTSILVVIWNWHPSHVVPYDCNVRLQALEQAVMRVQANLDHLGNDHVIGHHSPIKAIFVAPEYFFTAPYSAASPTGRGLGHGVFEAIHARLAEISARHPRILIVPGTITWMDVVDLQKIERQAKVYLEISERLMGFRDQAAMQRLVADVCARIRISRIGILHRAEFAPAFSQMVDASTVTGWRRSNPFMWACALSLVSDCLPNHGRNAFGHVLDFATEIQKVRDLPGAMAWGLRNTAVVFLDGREVHRYSKRGNFRETVNHSGHTLFMRGEESNVGHIRTLKIGFEICLDHDINVLASLIPSSRSQLDLHIVMSDHVDNHADVGNVLREGGHRIHASTSATAYGVWRKTGSMLQPLPWYRAEELMGRYLTMWVIETKSVSVGKRILSKILH